MRHPFPFSSSKWERGLTPLNLPQEYFVASLGRPGGGLKKEIIANIMPCPLGADCVSIAINLDTHAV